MKRSTLIQGIVLGLAFSTIQLTVSAAVKLAPGDAEIVYTFRTNRHRLCGSLRASLLIGTETSS